jgi:hypothetical protein
VNATTERETNMPTPRFDTISATESRLIQKIMVRAEKLFAELRAPGHFDRMSVSMDLIAAHTSGTPLKLEELLVARDGDFAHDVFGISRHIDRSTGQLDCFMPRYAAPLPAKRERAS